MTIVLDYLLPGALLGTIAGLTPGPLMALLISESIRSGVPGGVKVAISPLITDVPFIVAAIIVAKGIESSPILLGIASLIGASFFFFLAIQSIRTTSCACLTQTNTKVSLWKAVVVNLLNPHMHLYWFSVATPFFAKGDIVGSGTFAGALLLCAVLAMLIITVGISIIRLRFLHYAHWVLRGLGVVLLFFAGSLLLDGLNFLGIS